jgi:hypothetical protein
MPELSRFAPANGSVQAVEYPLQEQFNKQIQLYIFLQTEPVSRDTLTRCQSLCGCSIYRTTVLHFSKYAKNQHWH